MASCTTSKWATAAPQIKLEVTQSSSNGGSATLSWTLYYIANSSNINAPGNRSYSAYIDGSQVASGTYNINRSKGTYTITSGTKTITKGTSAKNISFSCSMAFNLTWSGVYGGTKSASGSISVSAKTSYTISYNANGGTGAPGNQTKWYGTNLKLSSTKPTRTGYSFLGWSTSSTATSATWSAGGTYTANASDTLYAVWKANTYTITYNANGGSGAPGNQTKTYGKTLTLSSTRPTRTNYNFIGWGTSASSTTVTYSPGGSYTANSAATLYAIWELAYEKPSIDNLTADRCDSNSVYSDEGTYVLVNFDWKTSNAVSEIKIEWRSMGSETWNTFSIEGSGNSGSISQIIGDGNVAIDSSYNIRVSISDSGGTTTDLVNIASIEFPIDLLVGGHGVAFGKSADIPGAMDINYDIYGRKHMYMDRNAKIYGYDPNISKYLEIINCLSDDGIFAIGYGNYDEYAGQENIDRYTKIYGHDIYFGISSSPTKQTFRPYYRRGDQIYVNWDGAGYVTSSGTTVRFSIPLERPVIGSPTVSITSINGFVLRQDNKYTHGTYFDTPMPPDSYTASYNYGFIRIIATFSNTTNVVNNSPIGISWNGYIHFS